MIDGIRTMKSQVYAIPESDDDMLLEIQLTVPDKAGRKVQHLIEGKIDTLFNEVSLMLNSLSDHTVL